MFLKFQVELDNLLVVHHLVNFLLVGTVDRSDVNVRTSVKVLEASCYGFFVLEHVCALDLSLVPVLVVNCVRGCED